MAGVTNVGQPVAKIDVGSGVTSGSFGSFSPNAGSTYVVVVSFDTDNVGTAATITISWGSGGSGTWAVAKFDQQNGFINGQAIWWVTCPSAPGASVINVASNGHISGFVATVSEFTGCDTNPVGAIVTDHTTTDHTITVTPQRDGSIIVHALGDRNESSTVTQGNMNAATTLLAAGTALNGLGETFYNTCSAAQTVANTPVTLGQVTATLTGTSSTAVEFMAPLAAAPQVAVPPDTYLPGVALLDPSMDDTGDPVLGYLYRPPDYQNLGVAGQQFTASLGGTVAPTGTLTNQAQLGKAGATTPAGALTKLISTALAGSISPTGALTVTRVITKAFAGAISPTGTLTKLAQLAKAGSVSPVGSLTKQVNKALAGSITPTGTLTLVRAVLKSFAGSITPTGTLTKLVGKAETGSTTPAGALTKTVLKALSGAITPAGVLTTARVILKSFAGAITPTGTLTKQAGKPLVSTTTPAGTLTKQAGKALAGAITPHGALTVLRTIVKNFAGSISPTGALTKKISSQLAGSITPAGALAKLVKAQLAGLLTAAGDLTLRLNPQAAVSTLRIRLSGREPTGLLGGAEPTSGFSDRRGGIISGEEQGD